MHSFRPRTLSTLVAGFALVAVSITWADDTAMPPMPQPSIERVYGEPTLADPPPDAKPAKTADAPQPNTPATTAPKMKDASTATPAPAQPPALRVIERREDAEEAPKPVDAAPAQPDEAAFDAEVHFEAADFNGVQAGKSTIDEVTTALGQPTNVVTQHNVMRHTYAVEPFERIQISFFKGKVQSIVIQLAQQYPPREIAKQLALDDVQPATIYDDFGEPMGQVLPERGVVFAFVPGAKEQVVAQVILEAIDAQPFVLRAESRRATDLTACRLDLNAAIKLDRDYGRAHWLKAVVLDSLGQHDAALASVDEALRLEPKNPEYRLTRAKILAAIGQFDKASADTKQALATSAARPEIKAQSLSQLGVLLADGPARDYKQALDLQMQAIRLAQPLTFDRRVAVRRTAQQVLLAAHLAAARDIAFGNWKQKPAVVGKWLERAEGVARDIQGTPAAATEREMQICRAALAACVGMEGEMKPDDWVERTTKTGEKMINASTDPLRQRVLQWEVGSALYDALQVYHTQGETESALKNGTLAVDYLEQGSQGRQLEPAEAYLLGRLYFRMGSVHASGSKDHEQAVIWFEKAVPLLERPVPQLAIADSGRHGETFVSMAVSYWSAGSHAEALRLTKQGVKLIEEAIKDGIVGEDALAVPYANLATMHRFLGDEELANNFTEMAAKLTDTTTK